MKEQAGAKLCQAQFKLGLALHAFPSKAYLPSQAPGMSTEFMFQILLRLSEN
jgi:hypothetical protein